MQEAVDRLREAFGSAVLETHDFRGDETVVLKKNYLREVCHFICAQLGFNMLMDICVVDYPDREERFEVVYHLYSMDKKKRIRLKVRAAEDTATAPSVHDIWPAANWFEREAFDMFGIRFDSHPNLKRLLTFEGFEGHPLRKDYPKNRRQGIPKSDPLISE
jgi:NADH-quinone oxidoreductase subunit C